MCVCVCVCVCVCFVQFFSNCWGHHDQLELMIIDFDKLGFLHVGDYDQLGIMVGHSIAILIC